MGNDPTIESMECAEVCDVVFEYRRQELDEPRRALVEAHVDGCADCDRYLQNLTELLAEATDVPPPADSVVDAMWDGIESRLGDGPQTEVSSKTLSKRPGATALLAAAIALAALAFGLWLTLASDEPPTDSAVGETASDEPEPNERKEAETSMTEAPPRSPGPELTLAASRPSVDIFAAAGTNWTLYEDGYEDGDELRLELRSGQLVLEVVPQRGERVVIDGPDRRVEVVGTVLAVTVIEGHTSVAVAAGAVRVTHRGGPDASSSDGTVVPESMELTANGLRPLSREQLQTIGSVVDLIAHRSRLEAAASSRIDRTAPSETERTAAIRRDEPDRPAHDELRESGTDERPASVDPRADQERTTIDPLSLAEQAQREGRYGDAVAILEALIGSGELGSAQQGLARLELARLYDSRLRQPQRAAEHLRRFLVERPADPAARSALRELCALNARLGVASSACAE